jgi:hypothetical protein
MRQRVFIWTAASSGSFAATLHVAKRRDYPDAHIAEGILDKRDVAEVEYEEGSASQPITALERLTSAATALGFHICRCDNS